MDPTAPDRGRDAGRPSLALLLPGAFALLLAGLAQVPMFRDHETLFPATLGAAGLLVAWGGALAIAAKRAGRPLSLETLVRRPHWVQACAQAGVFLYWGWHARTVYAFFPLMVAQVLFAYGIDALVAWSRRDVHRIGFGPLPIIGSINLFLLFRPQFFHWQFAMILVGYMAKEFIRWQRDGRSAHIFNPSSFPLGVAALVLLVIGGTDATLGSFIAQSQSSAPHMYALIFLVSIPGQVLFGVARMTLAAVVAMVVISGVYLEVTGVYMFRDAFITVPLFLGMHLLFTDPSTSPRTEAGQIVYGVLYALAATAFYFILRGLDLPTFYEKLLPVPLLNLMVRRIDAVVRSGFLRRLDPARIGAAATPMARNVAYTSGWVGAFALFSALNVLGDRNPGQYLPFWQDACEAGNERACEYRAFMTYNYCERGSGWACNEYGIYLAGLGYRMDALAAFRRACGSGFEPGCQNAGGRESFGETWARAQPRVEDLPIVLRGSKGPVEERDTTALLAMACDQGWPLCEEDSSD